MQAYILRRILFAIPTLFLVSIWVFVLMHLVPGDVILAKIAAAGAVSQASLAAARHELGLDQPLIWQYLHWIGGVLHLNAGRSLYYNLPVFQLIFEALPVTAELAILTMAISVLIGWPLGIIAAIYQDSRVDQTIRVITVGGQALPDFWNAIVLIVVLSRFLGYLPSIFYVPIWQDPLVNLQQMLFPAIVLGYRISATSTRLVRSSLLEVMGQDYVRTATAKGLSHNSVILRHALRNAMIPVITDLGTQFAFLLGGSVVMEELFSLPGLGLLTYEAVLNRDYPLIETNVLFLATIIIVANLIVDISYGFVDPRMRPQG